MELLGAPPLDCDPSVVVTVTVTVSVGAAVEDVAPGDWALRRVGALEGELRNFCARAYAPLPPTAPMTPISTIRLTNSRLSNRLFHLRFVLNYWGRWFLPTLHLFQLIPDV